MNVKSKNLIYYFYLLLFLLLSSCQTNVKLIENPAESEYRVNNSIPQEHVRFSPLRFTGERGKVFMIIEVQPTEVVVRPGFNQYQLYNQTLRGIIQTECDRHFKNISAKLGYVEYLEVQTQRYSNFSYRTWGKAVCHGFLLNLDYKL